MASPAASTTRASAGTRSPSRSTTRSPGTTRSTPTSLSSVPHDARALFENLAKCEHRTLCARLLYEAEKPVENDDCGDHRRLDTLTDQERDEDRADQKPHQRVCELS